MNNLTDAIQTPHCASRNSQYSNFWGPAKLHTHSFPFSLATSVLNAHGHLTSYICKLQLSVNAYFSSNSQSNFRVRKLELNFPRLKILIQYKIQNKYKKRLNDTHEVWEQLFLHMLCSYKLNKNLLFRYEIHKDCSLWLSWDLNRSLRSLPSGCLCVINLYVVIA